MTTFQKCLLTFLLAFCCGVDTYGQHPEVRLSFKFILDQLGNRPATGDINTHSEIDDQITTGNQILSQIISELRLHKVEVVEITGRSQWYSVGINEANRDGLRASALADPEGYAWRDDAVNVYITGANGSAIADFPPDNNIIVIGQGIFDTTLAHEVGHILNLKHTHESGGDDCADTIRDNEDWTRDQLSMANFGLNYNALNASQRTQVDRVWGNLMSYHDGDDRGVLSFNQMDRQSAQGYEERARFLTRQPVYINPDHGGPYTGSFSAPFRTLQQAMIAGLLPGRTTVLEQGVHAAPGVVLAAGGHSLVTRKGASTIQEAPPPYTLPYSVQDSKDPAVRQAIKRVQEADRRNDAAAVIAHLLEAEKLAAGGEKTALQLELAQRTRAANQLVEAEQWFRKVAERSNQVKLRKRASRQAEKTLEIKARQKEKLVKESVK